ncbi:MAG: M23 family metallopeptidase [Gemmatimonadaceae bacterium]
MAARFRFRAPARVVTTIAAGALAIAVIAYGRSALPAARAVPLAIVVPDSEQWSERFDTLRSGETLGAVLARGGLSGDAAAVAIKAAPIDERRVPAGMPVILRSRKSETTPSEVIFKLSIDRLVRLRKSGAVANTWSGEEERLLWTTDTIIVTGVIRSTLYEALDVGAATVLPKGARAELAWSMADVYEYRVDMSRELQPGDSFRVLFTRGTLPGGAVKIGEILAARFNLSGSPAEAVRFDQGGRVSYYDQTGKSMRAGFLRAPLEFRRISSVFGLRKHPILGIWRAHKGTDYAANAGTPVRSIGDGTVIFAGKRHGYGNVLEIRHRNGYVSRYGHLRAFAATARAGRRVTIGQTVAFVGMTGLATAPHLHFEILVNGVQRDPRSALKKQDGDPVPAAERARFDVVSAALVARLDLRATVSPKDVAIR